MHYFIHYKWTNSFRFQSKSKKTNYHFEFYRRESFDLNSIKNKIENLM